MTNQEIFKAENSRSSNWLSSFKVVRFQGNYSELDNVTVADELTFFFYLLSNLSVKLVLDKLARLFKKEPRLRSEKSWL